VSVNPSLRQRLRDALPDAIRARDGVTVAALRSTLAALDNAEAVDRPAGPGDSLAIERTPIGVGAAEVERRLLTDETVERIVRAEVTEREAAASQYDRAGRAERAARLRAEAAVLTAHLLRHGTAV
jgi:uncharacterized protein YqeY